MLFWLIAVSDIVVSIIFQTSGDFCSGDVMMQVFPYFSRVT